MKVLLSDELVDLPVNAGLPCFIYDNGVLFEYTGKVSVCGEPMYSRTILPSPVYDIRVGKLRQLKIV